MNRSSFTRKGVNGTLLVRFVQVSRYDSQNRKVHQVVVKGLSSEAGSSAPLSLSVRSSGWPNDRADPLLSASPALVAFRAFRFARGFCKKNSLAGQDICQLQVRNRYQQVLSSSSLSTSLTDSPLTKIKYRRYEVPRQTYIRHQFFVRTLKFWPTATKASLHC
jgi:hypothetical protein